MSQISTESAIVVERISKSFKIPLEGSNGIKQKLINQLKGRRGYREFTTLKNVSFSIKKGEFFGIVGRNGSGKSTLLKTIAGIYTPTGGSVEAKGSIVPFIELGVGFNPELTGRENVFLNGALLGFSHQEMEAMYDEIVDFAEIGDFMEERLKNYSSGMQVRLAFSIAIKAEGDVLLLDEVLAVGDAAFQRKCYDYFNELKDKKKTVILVTHDMAAVSRFCDRALYLEDGKIALIGSTQDVANRYLEDNYNRVKLGPKDDNLSQEKPKATIDKVEVSEQQLNVGDDFHVVIHYDNPEATPIHLGFQLFSQDGTYCFGTNTHIDGLEPTTANKGKVDISVKADLVPGIYFVAVATMNKRATAPFDYHTNVEKIIIKKTTEVGGIACLSHRWEVS